MSNSISRPRVLCTVPWLPDQARATLDACLDVVYDTPDRQRILDTIDRFDAWWLHFDTKCDAAVLDRAAKLRVVCTATTGTDHIDRKLAEARNIRVLHIANDRGLLDSFTATAELAWLLLLGLMRHVRAATRAAHAGDIHDGSVRFEGRQLAGRTLGVLGLGRLGAMTARFGQAFGMRVLGCDIKSVEHPGVQRVEFNTLLEQSDAISIHVHLNDQTRHMFNRDTLARMKPGAVLVNTSRGDIVDEQAVIAALESGRLTGYAADVLHDEWRPDMKGNDLVRYALDHDNVVLTPHIGGATIDWVTASRNFTARKLTHYLLHNHELTWRQGQPQPQ